MVLLDRLRWPPAPLAVYVALTALTMLVFALRPSIDLAAARLFFDGHGFMGRTLSEKAARELFADLPFVVLAAYAALWLARRRGRRAPWAPTGRAMVFLIATMILAPGLIVNLGLKDHWRRPRPYQTQEFHGADRFRAWWQTDGECTHNCSFVSGEASTGFWMVAPASLLPPPWAAPATAAAFAFGAGAGLLRMAFGGHYLSDVLLGGLITLIVIEIVRRLLWQGDENGKSQGPPSLTAAEVVVAALAKDRGCLSSAGQGLLPTR